MELVIRQGDVALVRVSSLPNEVKPIARESGRIVLAHGEVTSHSHAIASKKAELFTVGEGALSKRYLQVSGRRPAVLSHEEHGAITIEPGIYEVRIQREYAPGEIRRVSD